MVNFDFGLANTLTLGAVAKQLAPPEKVTVTVGKYVPATV
jgi:hypothetical protein